MHTASVATRQSEPQSFRADRKERLASLAGEVGESVGRLRTMMDATAPRGLASTLAVAMAWRQERRSREISGVTLLSVAGLKAEIKLHLIDGRRDVAAGLVELFLEGLDVAPEIPLRTGSTFRVIERNGKSFLRNEH